MPDTEPRHLTAAAREALALPLEERMSRIRAARWIGYTTARAILQQLEDLLGHPKTPRMPSLLIVGETNSGKTTLATRFVIQHPAALDEGVLKVPVLMLQAPPVPDELRFYTTILDALHVRRVGRDSAAHRLRDTLVSLRHVGVQLLIIDELQHALAGHAMRQRQFLNVVKYLANDLQIPIVGLGTKEALRVIQIDPQVANRFRPVALPRWHLDKEFQSLLASFERMLPLAQPSKLSALAMATKLLALTEGTIGELAALLTQAAVYAATSGRERIDDYTLAGVEWIPPSERKRAIERCT